MRPATVRVHEGYRPLPTPPAAARGDGARALVSCEQVRPPGVHEIRFPR
jgi:hypothetical protein